MISRRRGAATWIAIALVVGGVAWLVALWWPSDGLPDQWLDRGDQLASIMSVVLTATGVALAYLASRHRQERTAPQVPPAGPDLRGGGGPPRPAQLPRDTQCFTGRVAELAQLLAMVPDPEQPSIVVVGVIDGMAGAGKTALAVHAAYQIADRYPDGQLYVDLHGSTEAVAPVEAGEALDRMLRALGVPSQGIPSDLDDRAGLWRTTLASRRMLIVLDDAANQAQVAPLLPGAPGCLVLVTSRRRLAGLDHTHALSLGTLPMADALTLFTRTAGPDRVATEPPEVLAETVELCGRLPLAIRIAAARLGSHPTWSVAHLVELLRDQQHRLAELEAGPHRVTAAIEVSYQELSRTEQCAYRLLALHPGPDIDAYAAAALVEVPLVRARRLLDDLLGEHLLEEPVAGRYGFHDLVRVHALHAAEAAETDADQRAAVGRLLDHYRHTASVAADAAYPFEHERRPRVPPAATATPDLADHPRATAWLDTELPNLLAAARHASDYDWPGHALHLSAALHWHLRVRGRYRDGETLHRRALEIARATGNRAGELNALTGLGEIHLRQTRFESAADHYEQALPIAQATGNRVGELWVRCGLGDAHLRRGQYERAADYYGQALKIGRATGYRGGEPDVLHGLGSVHMRQGRYQQAIDHFGRGVEASRATRHPTGELVALLGLGWTCLRQGQFEQAAGHFGRVRTVARMVGQRLGEMNALDGLARLHLMQDRYEQAVDYFAQMLELARSIRFYSGELEALVGLGRIDLRQGRYGLAADRFRQVLDAARTLGDHGLHFRALHCLGRLRHATGLPEEALDWHQEALELATELGHPDDQARAHDGLAHAYRALNQVDEARRHWEQALDVLASLGTDHTEDEEASAPTIRAHLASLDRQPSADRNRLGRWRRPGGRSPAGPRRGRAGRGRISPADLPD